MVRYAFMFEIPDFKLKMLLVRLMNQIRFFLKLVKINAINHQLKLSRIISLLKNMLSEKNLFQFKFKQKLKQTKYYYFIIDG